MRIGPLLAIAASRGGTNSGISSTGLVSAASGGAMGGAAGAMDGAVRRVLGAVLVGGAARGAVGGAAAAARTPHGAWSSLPDDSSFDSPFDPEAYDPEPSQGTWGAQAGYMHPLDASPDAEAALARSLGARQTRQTFDSQASELFKSPSLRRFPSYTPCLRAELILFTKSGTSLTWTHVCSTLLAGDEGGSPGSRRREQGGETA